MALLGIERQQSLLGFEPLEYHQQHDCPTGASDKCRLAQRKAQQRKRASLD